MTTCELHGGVELTSLCPGTVVDIETKSHHYSIECLGGSAVRISGHPEYCPHPVPAHFQGSIDHDGVLEGFIGNGMRVIFFLHGWRPLTTSKVVSVTVDQPVVPQRQSSN